MKRILSSMLAVATVITLSTPSFSAEPEYKSDPDYQTYEIMIKMVIDGAQSSRRMKEEVTSFLKTDYSSLSKEQLIDNLKQSHEITISVLNILIAEESRMAPAIKQSVGKVLEKYGK